MTKVIRIREETYDTLAEMADYRDTMDSVVQRMIKVYKQRKGEKK
jgi:predicted CopG family antitoxin